MHDTDVEKISAGHGAILIGDVLRALPLLEPGSFRCCVTSPPYWGLRNYGGPAGEIGLEATVEEYVENIVTVADWIRRVLTDDGTFWLNIADTYAAGGSRGPKPKNLIGIPWKVAFALQDAGWWLRSDIIWDKPSCKPESAGSAGHSGRPGRCHEYMFLLAKSGKYFYDYDAAMEPGANGRPRNRRTVWHIAQGRPYRGVHTAVFPPELVEPCVISGTSEKGRCPECGKPWLRRVERGKSAYARIKEEQGIGWKEMQDHSEKRGTALKGGKGGCGGTRTKDGKAPHLSGSVRRTVGWEPSCECGRDPVPDSVLDPFFGSGTVGAVCERLGRSWCGIELNPEYARLSEARISSEQH